MQIMPFMIATAAAVTMFVPKLAAASAMRLSEAATRYSFNRTGMELLYLPLPADLKNRTKAFVDIFMDRFGRGIGGMVLMAYTALLEPDPKRPNLTRFELAAAYARVEVMASKVSATAMIRAPSGICAPARALG